MAFRTIVNGVYKPTNITGGPHIVPFGVKYKLAEGLPSGKRLHNYGKSPFSKEKNTINGNFQ